MEDILSAAEELLGPAVRVERHRDWAIFWCPFHGDKDRARQGGKPNFGVNLAEGYWKCLRCGGSGGSINSLRQKLGLDWKAPVSEPLPARPPKPPSRVQMLDEAMVEAQCPSENILLRDTDEAGREWAIKILAAIRQGQASVRAMKPPGDFDPDEAILKGWWNVGI